MWIIAGTIVVLYIIHNLMDRYNKYYQKKLAREQYQRQLQQQKQLQQTRTPFPAKREVVKHTQESVLVAKSTPFGRPSPFTVGKRDYTVGHTPFHSSIPSTPRPPLISQNHHHTPLVQTPSVGAEPNRTLSPTFKAPLESNQMPMTSTQTPIESSPVVYPKVEQEPIQTPVNPQIERLKHKPAISSPLAEQKVTETNLG